MNILQLCILVKDAMSESFESHYMIAMTLFPEIFQADHKTSYVILMPRNSDVSKVTQTRKANKIGST